MIFLIHFFLSIFGKWLLKLSLLSSFLLLLFSISLSFVFMAMEAVTHVSRCYLSGFTSIWLLENNDCFNDDNNNKNNNKTLSSLSSDTNGVLSSA